MIRRRYKNRRAAPSTRTSSQWSKVDLYIPVAYLIKLRELAVHRGVPMSRVVAHMIVNNFEQPYKWDFRTKPLKFKQMQFMDEAKVVHDFLLKNTNWMGLDVLVMNHSDLGLTLEQTRQGIEQLMVTDFLEVERDAKGNEKIRLKIEKQTQKKVVYKTDLPLDELEGEE